jgi:hypothetical protein
MGPTGRWRGSESRKQLLNNNHRVLHQRLQSQQRTERCGIIAAAAFTSDWKRFVRSNAELTKLLMQA